MFCLTRKEAQWMGEPLGMPDDWRAAGVSINSKTIRPGEVFFALKGEHTDGHQFVEDARARGAAACVVSRQWAHDHPLQPDHPWILVEDPLAALQRIARYHRERLDVTVIGITGSNGKTTSKEMLFAVLSRGFSVQATQGNLNNEIGVPLTLLGLNHDTKIAVVEMGATAKNDIRFLCDIARPDSGIVTNVGKAHLMSFGDAETVLKTKKELYDYLETDGIRFVNADLHYFSDQLTKPQGLITFGTGRSPHYRYRILETDALARASLQITAHDGETLTVGLSVSGLHFVPHAVAAFAIADTVGVSRSDITDALATYRPLQNRFHVRPVRGYILIDDTYNANPDSMWSALETLSAMKTNGKKIAVLGDMLELGQYSAEEHRRLGEIVTTCRPEALLTFGPEMQITHQAAEVPLKKHFENKKDLIDLLFQIITPGDIVLIKGSRAMLMDEVAEAISE